MQRSQEGGGQTGPRAEEAAAQHIGQDEQQQIGGHCGQAEGECADAEEAVAGRDHSVIERRLVEIRRPVPVRRPPASLLHQTERAQCGEGLVAGGEAARRQLAAAQADGRQEHGEQDEDDAPLHGR